MVRTTPRLRPFAVAALLLAAVAAGWWLLQNPDAPPDGSVPRAAQDAGTADAAQDAGPPPDAGPSPRAASVERPDILLVTVDTLRADRVGCYGYEPAQTPTIDGLAKHGVRFDEATVPFPRTTPALASLVTGLWPHHHGSREVWQPMKDGRTLAQVLADRGYATRAVVANPTVGPKQHFDRGFETFVPHGDIDPPVAETVTDRAIALAGHADPGQPLFLWAHYLDPHWPYEPPKSWEPQPEAESCRELRRKQQRRKVQTGEIHANVDGIAEAALEDCKKMYDAEIAYTDHEIGRLLDALDGLGRTADAFVVFAADHGENLGEWGLWYEHGPDVNDASMRIPLVMKGPGIASGRVDRGVARIEDVMPTLLSMIGVAPLEQPTMDGRDLLARIREGARPAFDSKRYAFAESGSALHIAMHGYPVTGRESRRTCYNGRRYALCVRRGGKHPQFFHHRRDPTLQEPLDRVPPAVKRRLEEAAETIDPETARQHTIRTPEFKLVERPQLDGSYDRALYDLRKPNGEERDVSRRYRDVARRLGARLDAWRQTLPSYEAPERDERQLQQLRALGYVE